MDFKEFDNNELKNLGFDPEKLTQAQKDVILEPINAPENYMCDGEISPAQAKKSWKNKLAYAGLNPLDINKAIKSVLG